MWLFIFLAQADRYSLAAVFSYEAQGNSFALMDKTEQGLQRIESGVTRLRDTVRSSGIPQAFNQLFQAGSQSASTAASAVQAATSGVNKAANQVKSSAAAAANALSPIKTEFKTLQAEARNIDFGDLQDPKAFEGAKRSLHAYISELDQLENQITGNTLADRKLKAELGSARGVATARVDQAGTRKGTLDAADSAMANAANLGKVQQVQNLGQGVTGFFNQPRQEAAEFGVELAGIGKLSDFGSIGAAEGMQLLTNSILNQSVAIATNRNLVSGVYENLAGAGKSFESFDQISAEAEAILKNASALDITTDAAAGLDINLGKVYQGSLKAFGGITGLNVSAGSSINALADNLANVKIDGQGVTETFSEMVAFLGDAQNFRPPDIAAFAAVMNSIGSSSSDSTSFMGRLDSSIAAHTDKFANALGTTVDGLNTQLNQDKYATYQKIFGAFNKVQGGDIAKANFLTSLGVGQSGDQAIIKKLATSQTVMADARKVANKAFKEGTSVTSEFNRVQESGTFQTQKAAFALQGVKTQMGLTINQALLPMVSATAKVLEGVLAWSQAHPRLTSIIAVSAFGMGVLAVAVGTLGVAFFGLRQAALESQLAMKLIGEKGILPITSYMSSATAAFGEAGFAGAMGSAGTSLAAMGTGLQAFGATVFTALTSPLSAAIATAAALYAAIEILTPGFNVLGAALSIVVAPFGLLFGIIKGIVGGIIGGLKPAFSGLLILLAPLALAAKSVFGGIPQALAQAADSFKLFADVGNVVGQIIGRTLVLPFTVIGGAINLVVEALKFIVNIVKGIVGLIGAIPKLGANLIPKFGFGAKKTAAVDTAPSLGALTSGVDQYFGTSKPPAPQSLPVVPILAVGAIASTALIANKMKGTLQSQIAKIPLRLPAFDLPSITLKSNQTATRLRGFVQNRFSQIPLKLPAFDLPGFTGRFNQFRSLWTQKLSGVQIPPALTAKVESFHQLIQKAGNQITPPNLQSGAKSFIDSLNPGKLAGVIDQAKTFAGTQLEAARSAMKSGQAQDFLSSQLEKTKSLGKTAMDGLSQGVSGVKFGNLKAGIASTVSSIIPAVMAVITGNQAVAVSYGAAGTAAAAAEGVMVAPFLPVIAVVAAVAGAIAVFAIAYQNNFLGLKTVTDGVVGAIKGLAGIVGAALGLLFRLTMAFTPIGWAITGVGMALQLSGYVIANVFDILKASAAAFAQGFLAPFVPVLAVFDSMAKAVSRVVAFFGGLAAKISGVGTGTKQAAFDVKALADIITSPLKGLEQVARVVGMLLNPLTLIQGMFGLIGLAIGSVFLEPLRIVGSVATEIGNVFTQMALSIAGAGSAVKDTVLAPLRGVQGFLGLNKPKTEPTAAAVQTPLINEIEPLNQLAPPIPVTNPSAIPLVQSDQIPSIPAVTPSAEILPAATAISADVSIQDSTPQIQSAWSGFGGWFHGMMGGLVDSGEKTGGGLIQALNHNPTGTILGAWQIAVGSIKGLFSGWIGESSDKGNILSNIFKGIADFAGGIFNSATGQAVIFGITSVLSLTPVWLIVGAVGVGVLAISTNFLGLRTIAVGALGIIEGGFVAVRGVIEGVIGVVKGIGEILGGIPAALAGDFSKIQAGFSTMGDGIKAAFSGVGQGAEIALKGISQIARGAIEGLQQIFSGARFLLDLGGLQSVPAAVAAIGDRIKTPIDAVVNFVKSLSLRLDISPLLGISDRVGASLDSVRASLGTGIDLIASAWSGLSARLDSVPVLKDFAVWVKGLPAIFTGAIDLIQEKWSMLTGTVGGFLNRLTGKSKQTGQELVSNLAESSPGPTFAIRQKWVALTGLLGGKFDQISGQAQATGNKIKGSLGGKIGDGLHGSLGKIGGGFTSLGSLVSNFSPQLAAPFFLVNDLADSFTGLSGALPEAQKLLGQFSPKLAGLGSSISGVAAPIKTTLISGLGKVGLILPVLQAGFMSAIPAVMALGGSIFAAILPALPIIAAVTGAVFLFSLAFKTNFLGIRSVLSGIGSGFGFLFGIVGALLNPFELLGNASRYVMDSMAGSIQWITGAWEGFSGFFGGLLGGVVEKGVGAGFGLIKALNHNPTDAITNAWRGAVFGVVGLLGDMTASATGRGGQIGDVFGAVGAMVTGGMQAAATSTVGMLGRTARGALFAFVPPLRGVFTTLSALIFDTTSSANTHTKGLFGSIASLVSGKVSGAFSHLRFTVLSVGFSALLSFGPALLILGAVGVAVVLLSNNFLGLKTIFMGVFAAIRGIISGVIQVFSGVFDTVRGVVLAVLGLIKGDFSGVRAGIELAIGGIRSVFSGIASTIQAIFSGAINFVRGTFQGVLQIASRFGINLGALIEPAKNMWSGFVDTLIEIEEKIRAVASAIAKSPVGRFVGGVAKVATGQAPTVNEGQSMIKFDQEVAEIPPLPPKQNFMAKLLGRDKAATAVVAAEQAVAPPASNPLQKAPVPTATTLDLESPNPTSAASGAAGALTGIVSAVNPMLGGLMATIFGVVSSVISLAAAIPAMVTGLATAGGISGIASAGLATLAGAATTAWAAISGPLLPIIAGIVGVGAVLGVLFLAWQTNFGGIQDVVGSTWNFINGIFSSIVGGIINLVDKVSGFLLSVLQVGAVIAGVVVASGALFVVFGSLGGVIAAIGSGLAIVGGVISTVFGIASAVFGAVGTAISIASGVAASFSAAVLPAIMAAMTPLLPIIAAIAIAMMVLPPIFQFLGNVINGIFSGLGQIIGQVWASFTGMFASIGAAIGSVVGAFSGIGKSISDAFAPLFGSGGSDGSPVDTLGLIGQLIVGTVLLPFQVVGSALSLIFNTIGMIATVIAAVLTPVIAALLLPFQMISFILQAVFSMIGSLATVLMTPFVAIKGSIDGILGAAAKANPVELLGMLGQAVVGAVLLPFQLIGDALGLISNTIGMIATMIGVVLTPAINAFLLPFQAISFVLQGVFLLIGALGTALMTPFMMIKGVIDGILGAVASVPFLGAMIGAPQTQAPPIQQFAEGGAVPGSGNQDNFPAWLTPGEFVMNPIASTMFSPILEAMNTGGGMATAAIAEFLPPMPVPVPVPILSGGGGSGGGVGNVTISLDVGGITIMGMNENGGDRSPADMATEMLESLLPHLERAVVDILRDQVEKSR